MPLIGTKLHVLNAVWRKKKSREDSRNGQPEEDIPAFIVPETQEICKNAQELQRKNRLYAANIWTCRVTGKSNLTFRDAVKSEVTSHRILRKNFPKCFERVILEMVHLSRHDAYIIHFLSDKLSIEALVHNCWLGLHEQFHVAEPVKLRVESVSSTPYVPFYSDKYEISHPVHYRIHGIINEVDKSSSQSSVVNNAETGVNSVSPNSSDKENTSSKKNSPVKKKNYAYTVKVLSDIPVVVHDVPACSIDRLNRAPVKDHIRMFIRAHAMRYGPNCSGPWIVDADMLRRYKLAPKCGGYEVDRVKLKQLSNEIEMEYFSRMAVAASRLYSPQITADGLQATEENDASQSMTTPIRPFKRTKGFSVLREGGSNKAKRENGRKSPVAEDELPLSTLKQKTQASTGKGSTTATTSDESGKRKMKQVTLFQFGKKSDSNPPTGTLPSTTKHKARTPSLPRAAQQLLKLFTEKPNDPLMTVQIKVCAKLLTDHDLLSLPTELRDRIAAQREAIARRKKLSNMTPQQRKAYHMEQRRQQRAEHLTAKRLIDDTDLMQQPPGLDEKTTALPDPTPMTLPDDFPQDLFGRLLGVAEFFHCFQTFLVDDSLGSAATPSVNASGDGEEVVVGSGEAGQLTASVSTFPLSASESKVPCWGTLTTSGRSLRKPDCDEQASTDDEEAEEEAALADMYAAPAKASLRAMRRLGVHQLMSAVSSTTGGEGGGSATPATTYRSLARPLSLLLRLLLRDEELNRKRELGIRLSKLPVTLYTAPELLRLVLLHELKVPSHSCPPPADDEEHPLLVSKADPDERPVVTGPPDSELINYLARADLHRLPARIRLLVLETAVERLFDLDLIDDHILVCQRRAAEFQSRRAKLIKDRKLHKKQQQQQASGSKVEKEFVPGKEEESGVGCASGEVEGANQSLASEDLASIVKRRRVLAAQAASKREEKEMLERERRAAQVQEAARDRVLAAVSRMHDVYQSKARCALRCQPLGYDRYYRRIWYLRSAPDRLFVESNWACPDIAYSVLLPPDHCPDEATPKTVAKDAKMQTTEVESTVPPPAQSSTGAALDNGQSPLSLNSWSNWAVYDCVDQLDQLASALFSRGIRESRLKQQLVTDGVLEAIKARWQRKVEEENRGGEQGSVEQAPRADGPIEDRAAEASRSLTSPRNIDADTALAGVLLKHILDTEVRLRSGGLGGVPNFEAWQEQLAELQDSLGLPSTSPNKRQPSKSSSIVFNDGDKAKTSLTLLAQALIHVADNVMPRFLKVPDVVSYRRTPGRQGATASSLEEGAHQNHSEQPVNGHVTKEEPGATGNGTDPVGGEDTSDSDSNMSHTSEVLKDPESHELRITTWLSLWRSEVSKAKTLARLSLLHACLDHCVRWEKSVEDARCRICRRKSDDDNLLLCDGCNLAFHLYCLRPPLRRVPAGDWFCVSCRPASRELERRRREARLLRSERRRRQHVASDYEAEAEEDIVVDGRRRHSSSEESEGNSVANSSSSELGCARRTKRVATGVDRLKRSHGKGRRSVGNASSDRLPSARAPVKHDSVCLICSSTSSPSEELVRCATCPNTFHLNCHNPPLHHVPRGSGWQCTSCRGSRNGQLAMTRTRRRVSYLRSCGRTSPIPPGECSHEDEEDSGDEVATPVANACLRQPGRPRALPTRSKPQRRPRSASSSSGSASSSKSMTSEEEEQGYRVVRTMGRKRRRVQVSSASSSSDEDAEDTGSSPQRDICSRLISMITKNRNSWPFRQAVNKDEVPDYYDIITVPVDLAMIQEWLSAGRYNGAAADDTTADSPSHSGLELLLQDLGQMFYNAELYNSADSDVWVAGSQLEHHVRQQVAQLKCGVRYSRPALGSL